MPFSTRRRPERRVAGRSPTWSRGRRSGRPTCHAIAIAAHNVPEGLAVAEPLRRAGLSGWRCIGLAALSGLGEPLGALVAVMALGPIVPPSVGGALAAGAMVVLAAIELIPEAFSHSYVTEAAVGLLAGVVAALGLLGWAL